MPNQKSTSYATILESIQKLLPTGREIYDSIMSPIESDLISENIVLLKEKYKNETSEERILRIERYKKALQKYDIDARQYFIKVDNEVESYRKSVENRSKKSEEGEIGTLEQTISNI